MTLVKKKHLSGIYIQLSSRLSMKRSIKQRPSTSVSPITISDEEAVYFGN